MEDNIQTYVELNKTMVTLSVAVTKDLKKEVGNLANFGHIEVNCGDIGIEGVFWDCLEYFFDIDKKKEKAIKKELREEGQYYKGVIKDIKALINQAKDLDLLCI